METLSFNNKVNKLIFDFHEFATKIFPPQKLYLEFDQIQFRKGQDQKDKITIDVKFTGPNNYVETIDGNPLSLGNFENPNDKPGSKVLLFHHFIHEIPQDFECQNIEFTVKSERNIDFDFDLLYKVGI